MRVEPVAFAFVTAALADGCLVRWDVTHVEVALDEELGEVPTETTRTFDSPAFDRAMGPRPCHDVGVSGCGVREVGVVDLAASCIEHGRSEGLAVRINADDVAGLHVVPPG